MSEQFSSVYGEPIIAEDYGATCGLGLQHALERSGHPDMLGHMLQWYTPEEQAAYGLGILFGWFMRVHPVTAAKTATWDASIESYRLDPSHVLPSAPGTRSTTGIANDRREAESWGYHVVGGPEEVRHG